MAKHSFSILELARHGAQHRYEELQGELSCLVRQFPDLRSGAREIVKRGRRAVRAAAAELQPRKRRKMSAACRVQKLWSGRQDVLVNHTTETIATLDTSLAPLRHRRHWR